jgi:hypothetical protein
MERFKRRSQEIVTGDTELPNSASASSSLSARPRCAVVGSASAQGVRTSSGLGGFEVCACFYFREDFHISSSKEDPFERISENNREL